MGRIRTIKPSFFKHEELFEAEKSSSLPLRIAFAGLWTLCDREGRFEWKPRTLKTDVMPYDAVDFSAVLDALAQYGFIEKYEVDGKPYGQVPSWKEHQVINPRESKSVIPFRDASARVDIDAIHARGEGKGKEEEREKEGKEAAPDDFPEGLSPLQYASGILEHCCIPETFKLRELVGNTVGALAKLETLEVHRAAEELEKRMQGALARGEPITTFWLTDGKWRGNGTNNGTRAGAAGRVERTLGAWDRVAAKRRAERAAYGPVPTDASVLPPSGVS